MFDFIKGEVVEINENHCILETNDFGYVLYMSEKEITELSHKQYKIFLRLIVREDSLTLYGFLTRESRILFDLLTSVSSVGPKVALGILSAISLDNIVYSISAEDSNILTEAPGVGKKTAQRIVLELKDKIAKYNFNMKIESVSSVVDNDGAIDALVSLGYNSYEAKMALSKVDKSMSISEQIKYALKNLGK